MIPKNLMKKMVMIIIGRKLEFQQLMDHYTFHRVILNTQYSMHNTRPEIVSGTLIVCQHGDSRTPLSYYSLCIAASA